MNLVCIICSDGISANSEIYTTQCGHLFHYPCLMQWIERSKTCPQCRNKSTEKTVHRIYLNLANTESTGDDIVTLQNKYDNLQFQVTLKEKDIKNLTQKYDNIKTQNIRLREEISTLENSIRVHDSVVHALKDQISYFKSKTKEKERYAEEVTKLKMRLKQMESVELLINGSRGEITELLKNENDVESLVILVATLKKALLDVEKKNGNMEHKSKQLQSDIMRYRKDIAVLQSSNTELRQRVELLSKKNGRERSSLSNRSEIIYLDDSEVIVDLDKISTEKAKALLLRENKSCSVEQDATNILQSNPECFSTKRSSDSPDMYVKKNQSFMPTTTGTKQVSIFRRPVAKLGQTETGRTNNLVYNGLGGQCKEDIYPSLESRNSGLKRQRLDGFLSSSKLRKVSSHLHGKKLSKS